MLFTRNTQKFISVIKSMQSFQFSCLAVYIHFTYSFFTYNALHHVAIILSGKENLRYAFHTSLVKKNVCLSLWQQTLSLSPFL